MSIFGIEEKAQKLRDALVKGLKAKAVKIMEPHASLAPAQIPKHELSRAQVLLDLAEILMAVKIEETPAETHSRRSPG